MRGLPVQQDHIAILHSGLLTRIIIDNGVVVTYGGPDLIEIVIPASHRKMRGLCVYGADKHSLNDSRANDISIFASSWSLSPPGTNCTADCELCSACNSTEATRFESHSLCSALLSPTGSFSGCHPAVDPEPFFQNCVNDLCMSNGNEDLFCSSLRAYTFACQEAGAAVEPWRDEKCSEYH